MFSPSPGSWSFHRPGQELKVDKNTGELLEADLKHGGPAHAIALATRSDSEITRESLYTIGCLMKVTAAEPADDGYLIDAIAFEKTEVADIHETAGQFYATCIPVPDTPDLDEAMREALVAEIRQTLHEISSHFQGSERFTLPIDRMESIDQIIGYVMPFTPLPVAEKQIILEMVSVRQRGQEFLELLVKLKEDISFRIEMARKVSEKVTRSNREAMLREQLSMIQEELGESEGGPGRAGTGSGSSSRRCPRRCGRRRLQRRGNLKPAAARTTRRHHPELPGPPARPPVGDRRRRRASISPRPAACLRATTTGSRRSRSGSSSTSRS